jgi:hypothetical protein
MARKNLPISVSVQPAEHTGPGAATSSCTDALPAGSLSTYQSHLDCS